MSRSISQKEINVQISKEVWDATETRVSPFESRVLECLKDGISASNVSSSVMQVLGKKLYDVVRPQFEAIIAKNVLLPQTQSTPEDKQEEKQEKNQKKKQEKKQEEKQEEKQKKKQPKKGSHASKATSLSNKEQIHFEVLHKKLQEKVDDLKVTFSPNQLNYVYGLHTVQNMEFRGLTLIYMVDFILKNMKTYHEKKPEVYELLCAIQRFITASETYQGKSFEDSCVLMRVSPDLIADLTHALGLLKKAVPLDGDIMFREAPSLMLPDMNKYAGVMPLKPVKMRPSQRQLMETIVNHLDGFLIFLIAAMGSGKTTLAVAIAAEILRLILAGKLPTGTQLLFVCNVVEVRDKVANDCWNVCIPFALTRLSKTGKAVITNHNMTTDETRLVVVASPEIAIQLLEKDPEKYVLFFDEPTCNAGKIHLLPDPNAEEVETSDDTDPLKAIARLWSILSKRTIVSSATLPLPEKLPTVLGPHLKKFPDTHVAVQITQEIPIAATFHTYDGKLVRLHATCETKQQLEHYIRQCKIEPQLGKMLSYPIAKQLRDSMAVNNVAGIPDIRNYFSQVDNMTADKVRLVCIEMLELVSNQSDEKIKKICSHTDQQYDTGSIDFANLGTTGAGKFLHMTLVATNNPIEFASKAFGSLIKDIDKAGFDTRHYQKLIAEYEVKMAEYKKNKTSEEKRAGEKKKSSSDGLRFEKETPGDSDCGSNIPKLLWPARFQVNTPLHIEQYGSQHRISSENMRSTIDTSQLPLSKLKDTDPLLMRLFLSGIGLIAPELIKDPVYNFEVSKRAKAGDFAFVICDGSIASGTNWSNLRTEMVMPDFPITHSFNTVKQVMGRAGRAGKSPTAMIYVDSATVQLLRDCAMNPENLDGDLEAQNINRAILCMSIRDYWKNRAELKKREYELQRSREVDAQLIARARYLTRNMDQTLSQIEAREAKQREEAAESKTNWRSQGQRDPMPKKAVPWESHAAEFAEWRNKPDVPERSEPKPLTQSTGLKYVPPQRQTQEPRPNEWRVRCTESKSVEKTPETAPDTNRNFSGLRNKPDAPQSSSMSSGSDAHKQDQLRSWLKNADSLPPTEVNKWQTTIRHNDLSKYGPIETPQNAQSTGKYVPPQRQTQEPRPNEWRDRCTESKCIERTPETTQDPTRNFSGLRNKPDALAQSTGLDIACMMGISMPSYCNRCNTKGMCGMKCRCGGYFMPK